MPEINTDLIDPSSINQDLMRAGIAGLRSGRFKKGAGYLHQLAGDVPGPDDTHCCLGALSIIAAENGCEVTRTIIGITGARFEMFGSQDSEFLSAQVMRCFGFNTHNPLLLTADGRVVTATKWNDHGPDGDSLTPYPEEDFGAIADAFERTYLPSGNQEGQ